MGRKEKRQQDKYVKSIKNKVKKKNKFIKK